MVSPAELSAKELTNSSTTSQQSYGKKRMLEAARPVRWLSILSFFPDNQEVQHPN